MWEELLHPYGIGTASGALLRLIRGVLRDIADFWRVRAHPPHRGLQRGAHLRRSFTRINQHGGITTAHESNTHTMTSYAHDAAGRWHSHTFGQQHCLPWRAAAARSDGDLHARDSCGIAFALLHTHQSVDAKPHRTRNERRRASSRRPGGSCPSPTASA